MSANMEYRVPYCGILSICLQKGLLYSCGVISVNVRLILWKSISKCVKAVGREREREREGEGENQKSSALHVTNVIKIQWLLYCSINDASVRQC